MGIAVIIYGSLLGIVEGEPGKEGPSFGGSDFSPSFDDEIDSFGDSPVESDIEEEPTEDEEEPMEELGAGDEDFEPAQDKEAPSGLRRELNTEA